MLLATLLSIIALVVLYPDIVTFQGFLPGNMTWELHDPDVSFLVYVPGVRTVRYELLTNFNLLWTNLRGAGMPLLGNEIQAAPLFPLTLLCLWIPDPYFWSIFGLARLLLSGVVAFLIARKNLNLSRSGSIVFMVCLGFSVHALRWNNHAWLNGFLAGLIYIHFLYNFFEGVKSRSEFIKTGLGLILGVYSMVTAGFPESSLMMAILALFLFAPEIVSRFSTPGFSITLLWVALFHLIGFCLSSPQLLALLDFMGKEAAHYRVEPGIAQYQDFGIVWTWLTRMSEGRPKVDAIHYFNLIPLFLFIIGLFSLRSRKGWKPITIGALISLLFFFIKNFPLWPGFNKWVGGLPVASASWFLVYSLALIIFPFAYFAGVGADALEEKLTVNHSSGGLGKVYIYAAIPLLLTCYFAVHQDGEVIVWRVMLSCSIFIAFCLLAFIWRPRNFQYLLFAFLVLELCMVLPRGFMPVRSLIYEQLYSHTKPRQFLELLNSQGINKANVREMSGGGAFVDSGISTFNNGTAPIIPYRMKTGIPAFFETKDDWGAAMPTTAQKYPFSWQMAGVTHYVGVDPSWSRGDRGDSRTVEYVGMAGEFPVFEDRSSPGRAYIARRCAVVATPEESMRTLAEQGRFQIGDAVLETADNGVKAFCAQYSNSGQRLMVEEDRGASVKLSLARGPAVLMLNDQYFKDWQVKNSLDGEELKILPGNYMFRAVVLDKEKDYRLEFSYRPGWLNRAITLVAIGYILMAGWLIYMFVYYPAEGFLEKGQ